MTKKELDHKYYLAKKHTTKYRKRNAAATRRWVKNHPEWKKPAYSSPHNKMRDRKRNGALKVEVLTHYGPKQQLRCSWRGCKVRDVDMLSLDHINNDGAKERKYEGRGGGGLTTYHRVRKLGYPGGFQTLCHNHQWKKELMRRRERNG